LCLSADDSGFSDRFHLIHAECACTGPDSRGPVLRCTVQASHSPQSVRVALDPVPGVDLLDDLSEYQGIRRSVGVAGTAFLFPRETRWERLVGQFVVHAILALQPEYFFFHAAAVAIGDRGVLLTGRSGSGKTSIALTLAARGHGFLSDEIGALRLASGELVPVRRSALVRPSVALPSIACAPPLGGRSVEHLTPDGHVRLCVPVSGVFPDAAARIVQLSYLIHLRRFAAVTQLERVSLTPGHLGLVTPIACSLHGPGAASRVTRLFALLGRVASYTLDAASAERAADAIEGVAAA
jgi:hypothetical protein